MTAELIKENEEKAQKEKRTQKVVLLLDIDTGGLAFCNHHLAAPEGLDETVVRSF